MRSAPASVKLSTDILRKMVLGLAEEARQREIARRRKEKLMAKRAELSSQLGHISDKRGHEENYVHSLNGDIESLSSKTEKSAAATSRIEAKLGKMQGVLAKQVQKLSTANDETVSLEADKRAASQEVETASSAEQYLLSDLHKAQLANDKAEQVVQEAIAHAKLAKARAEQAEADRKVGTSKLVDLQGRMAKVESALKAANDRHQIVKTHFETAKLDIATAQSNYDTAKTEGMELQAEYKSRQAELAAAAARLEAVHIQEHVTKSAIDLIDDDADMDVVQELLANTPAKLIEEAKRAATQTERPSFLGNFKRKTAKTEPASELEAAPAVAPVMKAAALAAAPAAVLKMDISAEALEDTIDIPADKVEVKAVPKPANDKAKSQEAKPQESVSVESKTGSRLYVSAAAISALAIGGLALSKNIPVSATPQPTQTVSFKAAMPALTSVKEAVIKSATADIPAAVTPTLETSLLEKRAIETAKSQRKITPEQTSVKPVEPVKAASLEKVAPQLIEKTQIIAPVQTATHSIQTRIDMQLNLSKLGFYSGEVSGIVGPKTKAAIMAFKQLFGMPSGSNISDSFLAELQSAVESSELSAEQDRLIAAAKQEQAVTASAQPVTITPVSEGVPALEPAAQTVSSATVLPALNVQAPAAVTVDLVALAVQESGTMTQTASLTVAAAKAALPIEKIAMPILEPAPDKVVEAKRINAVSAKYPNKALRRGFDDKIQVELQYDVKEDGTPVNLIVAATSDAPEKYKKAFEKAGLDAVKKMRFSPMTVNGAPTFSKDNKTRITFQTN